MKAYFFTVPGVGRVESYPSLLERRFSNGFEFVKIRVSSALLLYIAANPRRAKEILVEIYPSEPRPDPRDIIAPFIDAEDEEVGYSIRRGHYYLSQFMREHEDPRFTGKHLTCSCHPGVEFPLFISAFPNYRMEEDEQVASP